MSEKERQKGNEHFKCNENEDAYHCYPKSILLDPSNSKSFANRASVLIRLGNQKEAIKDYTRAFDIDPSYVKSLTKRAMIYHQCTDLQAAGKCPRRTTA